MADLFTPPPRHFARRSSVHALLHKAAAWELRRRARVSVRLRPALPSNLNFYINGLSVNYWGYIVWQLPCVTNGSADGNCFLLCGGWPAGGGGVLILHPAAVSSVATLGMGTFRPNLFAFCKPRMLRTLCLGLWNLVKVLL